MYKELEAYFGALATKHSYINHSEKEKHFYRIDVEEYLTKIDSAKFPFLSLERAEFNLTAPHTDNISQNRTVAFMLVNKFKAGDFDGINAIYDETEIVAKDIINRILSDVAAGTSPALLRNLDPNSISLQHLPAIPVELYCGVRVTMTIQSKYDKTVDTTKWSDLS